MTGARDNFGQAAAAIAAFALASAVEAAEQLARADRATMAALPAWRNPCCVAVARAVSKTAEPAVAGPVLALAALAAVRRGDWRSADLPTLVVPAGMLARWLLSEVIARPRPPAAVWLAEPEGYSLPSRHTTLAVLTVGAAAAAVGVEGPPAEPTGLLVAACVGASRVCLGVHLPSDVAAGWLFARGWLYLAGVAGLGPATRGRPRRSRALERGHA